LSILNLPLPPVRFLGQACRGHERWHLNRDLTTEELEARDKETLSMKYTTNEKQVRCNRKEVRRRE
jgi:hypothetical protein